MIGLEEVVILLMVVGGAVSSFFTHFALDKFPFCSIIYL
jgi:hypothetical protein